MVKNIEKQRAKKIYREERDEDPPGVKRSNRCSSNFHRSFGSRIELNHPSSLVNEPISIIIQVKLRSTSSSSLNERFNSLSGRQYRQITSKHVASGAWLHRLSKGDFFTIDHHEKVFRHEERAMTISIRII